MKAAWLEVYKKNGEWKIADAVVSNVFRTKKTKREAVDTARAYLGQSRGSRVYVSVQVYDVSGTPTDVITDPGAVRRWTRSKSRSH